MRPKLLGTAAAIALTAGVIFASAAPASAQGWRWGGWRGGYGWGGWRGGYGWGWPAAAAAGIVGGTIAAATSPLWAYGDYYDYDPGYGYGGYGYAGYGYPGYGYSGYGFGPYGNTYDYAAPAVTVAAPAVTVTGGGNAAWCESRYRSYNPATGTFLGYDGLRHPCP
jgi:hypothetical protein